MNPAARGVSQTGCGVLDVIEYHAARIGRTDRLLEELAGFSCAMFEDGHQECVLRGEVVAGVSAALFGLLLVALDGNRANTTFQCAVIAALIAAYVGLDRRLSYQGALEFT